MKYFLVAIFILFQNFSFAQNTILTGIVKSETAEPLSQVNISVKGYKVKAHTTDDGKYSLALPNNRIVYITYTRIGYKTVELELGLLIKEINTQDVILVREFTALDEVDVSGRQSKNSSLAPIDPKKSQFIVGASGNFESAIKLLQGVSVNNELSSQYSVRGGNYDENLVYVNDIEIFRPQLIRNGQQEGLSFINPELASTISFSAGGFEAKYGDKLSSVLNVRYYKPDSNSISTSVGLNGYSAALKLARNKSFLVFGSRRKDNSTLLRSQPVKGSYQPNFTDFQFLYQYELGKKVSIALLGDYNLSQFTLEPESRETQFGTSAEVFRLKVDYAGKELDRFKTLIGGFTMTYKPSPTVEFKWINSATRIHESENLNIEGTYVFEEVGASPISSDENKVSINRGIGQNFNYSRNDLKATVVNTELRLYKQYVRSYLEAGLKFQQNTIVDRINEYTLIDSAGYSLPNNFGSFNFPDATAAQNNICVNLLSAFVQNTCRFSSNLILTAGLRSLYNSYTKEFLLSPRFSLNYQLKSLDDFQLRLAGGVYNQPPFYKELRNFNGALNDRAKSQKSIHLLAGADYGFVGLGTRLKFTSEIYYKFLNQLTPYKIENLRIRYFADQQSKGYATGADFSLSGEFVKSLESSFRLSIMKTAEDIQGDYKQINNEAGVKATEVGFLKRPTDQRVNFSMFFQDRLPKNPSYKVHLSLLYGSALPVGPPLAARYKDVFTIPAYKRVDIGFSKDFIETDANKQKAVLKKYFQSLVAQVEVFNLLDFNNIVSYLWIKDVNNNQFAIPNYLTSRQLNIKIIARFH